MNIHSLQRVLAGQWQGVEIGGVVPTSPDEHTIAANHVYIDCATPLLIAATSIDDARGHEHFGVTAIEDAETIRQFREGPHPNCKPTVMSLEALACQSVATFLHAHKDVHVLMAQVAQALPPLGRELIIDATGARLRILADESIPMGLLVGWTSEI